MAAAIQVPSSWAADPVDPAVSVQDMSHVDIGVGSRNDPAVPGAFGIKLFPQPLPGTAARTEIGAADRAALRREFTFLGEVDDASLPDVVAAVRNDPDQPAGPDEGAGAAVNEWTATLDSSGEPVLAPPPVKQAPPDAAGRSPSGMGSQIIP
jgi:hypothetical protein